MKCIVLAAGYATRLYPLTENFPKPLLTVKGKTILDWLLDDANESKAISETIIISNHKFVSFFQEWAKSKPFPITVLDDGTISNETRLGAVSDIQFAVKTLSIDDDVLILAGDNLLDFSLQAFIQYAKTAKTSCVMRYYEETTQKLQKSGVLEIDGSDLVLSMEEKPAAPKSHWCCPPFYFYTRDDIKRIQEGIDAGCGIDAPGSYVSWLCKRSPIHAMEMPGKRYDIGNLESYQEIQKNYKDTNT